MTLGTTSVASRSSSSVAGMPPLPTFCGRGAPCPVLGPASCVIERAKDRYRFHLLVKSPVGYHVSDYIDACLKEVGSVRGVSVSVDVDAYDLM